MTWHADRSIHPSNAPFTSSYSPLKVLPRMGHTPMVFSSMSGLALHPAVGGKRGRLSRYDANAIMHDTDDINTRTAPPSAPGSRVRRARSAPPPRSTALPAPTAGMKIVFWGGGWVGLIDCVQFSEWIVPAIIMVSIICATDLLPADLRVGAHHEVGLVVRLALLDALGAPLPLHRQHRQHDRLRGPHRGRARALCRYGIEGWWGDGWIDCWVDWWIGGLVDNSGGESSK